MATERTLVPTPTSAELAEMKVGDTVTRWLCGEIPMHLVISEIDETYIHCGPWKFLKTLGTEVDEDIGMDGIMVTSSYLRPKSADMVLS